MEKLRYQTVVVGTGAAGYNAACRLRRYGAESVAVVTEDVRAGTSRNTGSDKQTYYKLTLAGGAPDSVLDMAGDLFAGQAVDGDIALCEAALSAPSFLRLAELGVPFPKNRYGEYAGYRTDHDPRSRAASAGPYTSRMMTEALEKEAAGLGIPVLDRLQAVRVLTENGRVTGLLCLNRAAQADPERRFTAIACTNVVLATGGPAGIYRDSVYPESQFGGSALAFRAGAAGRNLTEWQYGLASVSPRWNVSGTYMQALPRFVSTDARGEDPREFLADFFAGEGELLTRVFLKGYQWPFDVRKAAGGSSVIDILVWLETQKGRRVWLDYRENPGGRAVPWQALGSEARAYLERAGACFGTPLDRLRHMNAPAVDFYREHGVDLGTDRLEIALCAQHCNGGIAVSHRWQTAVRGLFAAGEAAGTHGVYRPGGSALNAGQAGSARAAEYIAARCTREPDPDAFERSLAPALAEAQAVCGRALGREDTLTGIWNEAQARMSRFGGPFRNRAGIREAAEAVKRDLAAFGDEVRVADAEQLYRVFRLQDMLLTQQLCLAAMADYAEVHGLSRGSALYTDPAGERPDGRLPEMFACRLDDGSRADRVQEVWCRNGGTEVTWRRVRPIPREDDFFENVWRNYRENGCMDDGEEPAGERKEEIR